MKRKLVAIAMGFLILAACTGGNEGHSAAAKSENQQNSELNSTGEWLLHGQDRGEQRHSPLAQINKDTVSDLGLAFSYEDFVVRGRTHRGVQATPLMEDGVLYFTGGWSVVYAVDAVTGEELWVHDPEVEGARARAACCDVINRGVALSGDNLFVGTLDGYLLSIDKKTGEEVWRVNTFVDRDRSYTITGAPRLAGDLVVIGNGGADMGVRGYVTAYDMKTGEQAWRFFTVPGEGPDETIDITRARETWSENTRWNYGGGGTVWDSMVYDEEQNIMFVGTGNGSPWPVWDRNRDEPAHDNLYVSSIVALDADTGLVKWHYQTTPGDSWDYTATQHIILADIEWEGAPRKVLMQAPKNGFFYVIDRVSGELLSAEAYVPVSWADGVDLETGRPNFTQNGDYSKQARIITPGAAGGHNWPPMAYNPDTGLVYIPSLELSLRYERGADVPFQPFLHNTFTEAHFPNPEVDAELLKNVPPSVVFGRVKAWDPSKGEARWVSKELPYWTGGMLSTAGGLAIGGAADGVLYFYDAESGEVVHEIKTGLVITAPPMTYEIDGTQYIAVLAGTGGIGSRVYFPGFAALEYANSAKLFVFKLGGSDIEIAPRLSPPERQPVPSGLPTDPETIEFGRKQYARFCYDCHTRRGAPSSFPDLWNMHPNTYEIFDQIVLEGAYEYAGMASFSDILTAEDTLAIKAYIAADRKRMDADGISEPSTEDINVH